MASLFHDRRRLIYVAATDSCLNVALNRYAQEEMRTVQALSVDEALWAAGVSGPMSISLEYFLGIVAV